MYCFDVWPPPTFRGAFPGPVSFWNRIKSFHRWCQTFFKWIRFRLCGRGFLSLFFLKSAENRRHFESGGRRSKSEAFRKHTTCLQSGKYDEKFGVPSFLLRSEARWMRVGGSERLHSRLAGLYLTAFLRNLSVTFSLSPKDPVHQLRCPRSIIITPSKN